PPAAGSSSRESSAMTRSRATTSPGPSPVSPSCRAVARAKAVSERCCSRRRFAPTEALSAARSTACWPAMRRACWKGTYADTEAMKTAKAPTTSGRRVKKEALRSSSGRRTSAASAEQAQRHHRARQRHRSEAEHEDRGGRELGGVALGDRGERRHEPDRRRDRQRPERRGGRGRRRRAGARADG